MICDLDKNYRKFHDYSRFSLTFRKNGLFSRFSRFSMNPVFRIKRLKDFKKELNATFKLLIHLELRRDHIVLSMIANHQTKVLTTNKC